MKLFKFCFFLILCVVVFSGCLNNNAENNMTENKTNFSVAGNLSESENNSSDSVIKASDPNTSTFSGTVRKISKEWNGTYITLTTDHESYYGLSQMTFVLNNDTILDAPHEPYKPTVDSYMFVTYPVPEEEILKKPVAATYATVLFAGMTLINGTVTEIRKSPNAENTGGMDIILDSNGTPMVCRYFPVTYFTADIKEGMAVTLYCTNNIATSSPPICWPYEV